MGLSDLDGTPVRKMHSIRWCCIRGRETGLWNVNHVDETYDPAFLDRLQAAAHDATTV
ncbi:hypothetical protein [Salinirubrum litoreum]|uniref:GIY-YIG domain-containing protein n=1 Tax=Salinirubrum litoreum TaxID=1126234 RepID=A0ABD5RB99_9EURY|nr:hypothetical protein [Salinirubrum litoreum]